AAHGLPELSRRADLHEESVRAGLAPRQVSELAHLPRGHLRPGDANRQPALRLVGKGLRYISDQIAEESFCFAIARRERRRPPNGDAQPQRPGAILAYRVDHEIVDAMCRRL